MFGVTNIRGEEQTWRCGGGGGGGGGTNAETNEIFTIATKHLAEGGGLRLEGLQREKVESAEAFIAIGVIREPNRGCAFPGNWAEGGK